ncbi:MAG: class I SAM-dependent methyltransferase [Chitinophagaceae bacterium]|nr:class I SAM-dependent methyltransferase [Chitinophagaceae bacterium]
MKDNFSNHADLYASYRPEYPASLYRYILSIVPGRDCAWDCGTGNGQVAAGLSPFFKTVYATDISAAQLQHAQQKENITYTQQEAEHTRFPAACFDLIIVAQAVHWFDFERFYAEVRRTAKPGGVLVVTGYGLPGIDEGIDRLLQHFYTAITGPYWDPERKYIDEAYKTIPFPFDKIEAPELVHRLLWTREQFTGYLNTWSAVQHYIKDKGYNPITLIEQELHTLWPESGPKTVRFPILLRAARIAG